MNKPEADYSYVVDNLKCDVWHELLLQFDDASFYQTWSYGVVHSGEKNLSHLVLKKREKLVAMAQTRTLRIPGLPIGMAYVNWGPMWKLKREKNEVGHLRNMLRALYNEYVVHRKYFLRIVPSMIDSQENAAIKKAFEEEGFWRSENPVQTVVLDLSPPLDEIRRKLSKKWRQTLQSGEKKGLGIIEGKEEKLCQMSLNIFREMKDRKGFFGGDQAEAIAVHRKLPESLKLHFMVCTHDSQPIAALGWVTFGSTGLPLVGATSVKALKVNASYVLFWKMIEYYKIHGFSALDLGGVSEERNPGGYYFKTHIVGKNFKQPDRYLGRFDACKNAFSKSCFEGIDTMRDRYRDIRRKMAKRRSKAAGSYSEGLKK